MTKSKICVHLVEITKADYCPSTLPSLSNASPAGNWQRSVGSVVTYNCSAGYVSQGSPAATCNQWESNEGKWEMQVGYCRLGKTSKYIKMLHFHL